MHPARLAGARGRLPALALVTTPAARAARAAPLPCSPLRAWLHPGPARTATALRPASAQTHPAAAVAPAGGGEELPAPPHVPVLLHDVLAFYKDRVLRSFVDGTLGAGGHAAALVAQHPELTTLIGIDMDPAALRTAQSRLHAGRATDAGRPQLVLVQSNFSQLKQVLERHVEDIQPDGIDGILLDLGMSSMQVCCSGN